MWGMRAAILLAIVTAVAGCGSSGSSVTPTGSSIRVTSAGTDGFVPVGTSGVNLFAPPGTLTQEALLSTTLITSAAAVGAPFPGSDTFLTGLQFGTSISPLVQSVQFQIPLSVPTQVGAAISVFELTSGGFAPVTVTNSAGTFVPFAINRPGTFVFAAQ